MKNVIAIVVVLVVASGIASAQFKSQVDQETQVSIARLGDSQSPLAFMFGWFNPDKFSMRHSFDMSYTSFSGYGGMSLGTYTNTMRYAFSDNLNARADVAFSFSPFNSIPQLGKNDLNKVYLSRAEVNYKPWENVSMQIQYRQVPFGSYLYSPYYYNPWYRETGF